MSESNVIHENFHTKHSVFTAPDEHMPYIRERECYLKVVKILLLKKEETRILFSNAPLVL